MSEPMTKERDLIRRMSLALAGWNYEFGIDGTIGRDEAAALIREADAPAVEEAKPCDEA